MNRREINIFGTSFLDLLSGALAAVIILFVIVPKMSSTDQNALAEIERLHLQVSQLDSIIEQARNSVPQNVFNEIQERLRNLQSTISQLSEQVENLQNRLALAEEENAQFREQIDRLQDVQNQNGQLIQENQRLQERVQELENNQNHSGISDGKVFGMNAKLGIVCMWPEINPDVDLYVKDLSSGVICFFNNKSTTFGNLMEDVTSRRSQDDDRYELFYQSRIVPGTYEVYVNIYRNQSTWNGQPAHVNGYIVLNPGKTNQKKIEYSPITITQKGVDVHIGTLTISENDIILR